jgi:hypothetical protein
MTTLLICGLRLTSKAFDREHILWGFDSPVLTGLDIPSECFEFHHLRFARLSVAVLAGVITSDTSLMKS